MKFVHSDNEEMAADYYSDLRELLNASYTEISKSIPQGLIVRAGAALGVEDVRECGMRKLTIVVDHCMYSMNFRGRPPIQAWIERRKAEARGIEVHLLAGASRTFLTVVQVLKQDFGFGLDVLDLFHGTRRFVMDMGLSMVVGPGMEVAGRFLDMGGFFMGSGAAIQCKSDLIARAKRKFSGLFEDDKLAIRPGHPEFLAFERFLLRSALEDEEDRKAGV